MRFSIQQNTIQGKRHENQDRMGYIYTREALLLVICDGLGGHGNGEMAATWALKTMAQRFQHFAKPTFEDPQAFLEASIVLAHARILKNTLSHHLPSHPRTTIACALIQKGKVWIAHAGDSRVYLIRNGLLLSCTKDHSKLQYLVDIGKISAADAPYNHPGRNRLINCIGGDVFPFVEHTGPFDLSGNDTVLLCSDGVWGVMEESDLLATINHPNLSKGLPELVNRAAQAGGDYADDATAIAMRWLTEIPTNGGVDSSTIAHEFESTVHLTLTPDTDISVMTDKEMDDQITEINQALEKLKNRHKQ
jgi:PPM family protein phosphatase